MQSFVIVLSLLLVGGGTIFAKDQREEEGGITLTAAKARDIFRLVEGQAELRDKDVSAQLTFEGELIPQAIWTCVWIKEGADEVVVMQIRDRDGAYRKPNFADPDSLKFTIRFDLREKIQAIIRRKKKPSRQ